MKGRNDWRLSVLLSLASTSLVETFLGFSAESQSASSVRAYTNIYRLFVNSSG